MKIFSLNKLVDFARRHPNCRSALTRWRELISQSRFGSFNELRETFPHADLGKKAVVAQPEQRRPRRKQEIRFTVFNIGGNKARLIATIHYASQVVTIHQIFTHAEYDAWMKTR